MAGFILGFLMMPATLALIGGFVSLFMYFKVDRGDAAAGMATGVAALIIAAVVAFKFIR